MSAGRPRQFDEAFVLGRALEVFWTHGYEATSVSDLLEATGLQKGSLYQAFGDKRSLFLRTLENYLAGGRAGILSIFESEGTLRDRLARLLTWSCSEENGRKGCYAVNCLVELAPHDEEVSALLDRHYRAIEEIIAAAIERGAERGEIARSGSSMTLARLIVTLFAGSAVTAKSGRTPDAGRAVIDSALDYLLAP